MSEPDDLAIRAIGRSRNPEGVPRSRRARRARVPARAGQAGHAHHHADQERRPLRLGLPARPRRDGAALRGRQALPVERATDLDWSIDVDPYDASRELMPDSMLPLAEVPEYRALPLRAAADPAPGADRLDPLPVPPRRAGGAVRRVPGHRGGALDRRQALRLDPGRRRGPPRRGLPPLPHREARQALPDQRQPLHHHRRADDRRALGPQVPRHADHDRGPRAGGVRHHPAGDPRAAAARAAAAASSPTRPATSRSGWSRCASYYRGAAGARATRARGLGLRDHGAAAQPLPGPRVLRRVLRAPDDPAGVEPVRARLGVHGPLPPDHVPAADPQPPTDPPALRSRCGGTTTPRAAGLRGRSTPPRSSPRPSCSTTRSTPPHDDADHADHADLRRASCSST